MAGSTGHTSARTPARNDVATGTRSQASGVIIKRPRLTKLLHESRARVILLVAPAGYGKTTLAREWVAQQSAPVAWYRATAASADVVALAAGVATALDAAVGDESGRCASRMELATRLDQRPDVLARTLAASRDAWPAGLVLALDDYHLISVSPEADEFASTLFAALSAQCLLTSRSRPAWLSARLEVYGEILEVRASELAMTEEEVGNVLALTNPTRTASALTRNAAGWPAMVGAAARALPRGLPGDRLPRQLHDFLIDELLDSVAPEVQEAAALVALANIRDLALARKAIGEGGATRLREARKWGIIAVDEAGQLSIHPLVRDVLIANARAQTDDVLGTLVSLGRLLLDEQRWEECLALAECFPQNHEFVLDAMRESLDDLLATRRVATVARWVALAQAEGLDHAIVNLAAAEVATRLGAYDRAIAMAKRAVRKEPPKDIRCRAQLVAARAAHLGDDRRAAREFFDAAEASAPSPRLRADARWGQFLVECELETGDVARALRRFEDASDGSVDHELRRANGRLLAAVTSGDMRAAADAAKEADPLTVLVRDPLVRLSSLNQEAWVLCSAGDYEEALRISTLLIEQAQDRGIDFAVAHGRLTQAKALIGIRRFAAAQQAISRLEAHLRQEPDEWTDASVAIQRARLQISLCDLERATEHLMIDVGSRVGRSMRSEYDAYRALVAAAQGLNDRAESCLSVARQSRHGEALGPRLLAEAVFALNSGDLAQTLSWFQTAIDGGFRDAIIIACRAAPRLARAIASSEAARDLADALSASGDDAIARAAGLRLPRLPRHRAELSPRELEVLELVVQGLTNPAISDALFISESTTKVHVRHILKKLGARSRVEAAQYWQRSGLGGGSG